jgi:hypothetical protein
LAIVTAKAPVVAFSTRVNPRHGVVTCTFAVRIPVSLKMRFWAWAGDRVTGTFDSATEVIPPKFVSITANVLVFKSVPQVPASVPVVGTE